MPETFTPPPIPPAAPAGMWERWSSLRLALFATALLLVNFVGQAFGYLASRDMFVSVVAGAFFQLALAHRAAVSSGIGSAEAYSIDRPSRRGLLLAGAAALGALIPAAALAGLSSLITSPPAAWLELYNEHIPDTPLKIAIALVAVGLVGPIAEELLYRGVVHRLCRRHWGALPAAVISSLLFALLHGEPWFLFGLFALGMLYAFVYETTGSLTLCVAAHSLHNVISMVMMLREGALAAPPEAFVASDLPWLVGSLVVLVPALRGLRALRRRGD